MRTDNNLDEKILISDDWSDERPDLHLTYNVFETIEEDGQKRVIMNSLSGWERNHLFMNTKGKFEDVSLISGMDSEADSRAHCSLDFNRDGYSDVAVVSGSRPQLQLFENHLGDISKAEGNFLAVKLVGGNDTDQPSEQWSCRDAVGTLVRVTAGDTKYVRELRFGEGFAGQNSATLLLGLGPEKTADLEIRWLSGKTQMFSSVDAGKLATIHENPAQSDNEDGIALTAYASAPDSKATANKPPADSNEQENLLAIEFDDNVKQYALVTSMATWCSSCKKMKPQLQVLQDQLSDRLTSYGFPMDENDSAENLKKYVSDNKPAYKLLDATDQQREAFANILTNRRGKAALPGSILMNKDGAIIESWLGVPSISELASILDRLDQGSN